MLFEVGNISDNVEAVPFVVSDFETVMFRGCPIAPKARKAKEIPKTTW